MHFFQAEKGRENRFIVLLGGSTGCRTKLHPPAMASSADFLSLSLSPSPRFLRKLQQNPPLPYWGRADAGLFSLRWSLGSWSAPPVRLLSGGLWAPGQHLLCVCSSVASGLLVRTSCAFALRWSLGSWSAPPVRLQGGSQCWTRADLGSRKEAPRPPWGGCRPLRVARARPGSGCAQKAGG